MKRAIEPADIRKGDHVRAEWDFAEGLTAGEFLAFKDGTSIWPNAPMHFLLDRPAPAVELPTEPTLGWIEVVDLGTRESPDRIPSRVLGVFKNRKTVVDGGVIGSWSHDYVTGFLAATAVPTSALDKLRTNHDCSGPLSCLRGHVDEFLAAVDEANR